MNVPKLVLIYLLIVFALLLIDNQFKKNCADFWTTSGAQQAFDSGLKKFQHLDRNHNLIACE